MLTSLSNPSFVSPLSTPLEIIVFSKPAFLLLCVLLVFLWAGGLSVGMEALSGLSQASGWQGQSFPLLHPSWLRL